MAAGGERVCAIVARIKCNRYALFRSRVSN
jgi:hypothetical protein